ncbi:MAG: UDP-N-acetylmuramoyl-tripeptide--D-alanyl-D-alanine ligase [Spirochaetaceae bacterium]|jgi:UDP-N-acetylmuramoyl-tripeptide--D-alanyl-D-alanine ligase|nr:UDP-N-acetylmuramoyl-tripeptide--D-alanyl-D-alanine ligase [Spirochaetaceae bacterium]
MDNILMTFSRLSRTLGARLISFQDSPGGFSSVSVDSRTAVPLSLFVALAGDSRDGHAYVGAAFRAGAAAAMVAEARMGDFPLEGEARKARGVLVVVRDTLEGFQKAAAAYLEGFPRLLRIGITGSSGKTTTKEIAAAIISREKTVVMNRGNLNSETGLPLSVFAVRSGHEVGIFEMGMNRKGEIAELAAVLRPHIALVTNIGSAHIGILGSRGGIAQEKKAIFSRFTGNETALIPEDDDYRDFLAEGVRGRVRFFGPKSFAEMGEPRDLGLDGAEFIWEGTRVRFGIPGRHNIKNALAAAAIAREIPVGAGAVRRGLEAVKPLFGRSEILRGPVTVIRDCYNANPESAAGAVAFCDELEWPGRRIYVIGSMLELGDLSPEAHRGLGRILAASRADMVFLFGAETAAAAEILQGGARGIPFFHTGSMEVLSRAIGDFVRPGDLVLLKGSRGCALERLAEAINPGTPAERGVV